MLASHFAMPEQDEEVSLGLLMLMSPVRGGGRLDYEHEMYPVTETFRQS